MQVPVNKKPKAASPPKAAQDGATENITEAVNDPALEGKLLSPLLGRESTSSEADPGLEQPENLDTIAGESHPSLRKTNQIKLHK